MRGNDAFSPSYKARKWAHGLLMNGRKEKQGGGGKRAKAGWKKEKVAEGEAGKRERGRERREKSLVNGALRRERLNCHFVSKEKDTWLYRVQRSWKRIEKARARLMFSYFRWRTRFRDTERCIQTMKHSCSHGDEKEGGGIDAVVKNNVG